MADDNTAVVDQDEERRKLEEFQRQQAAQAYQQGAPPDLAQGLANLKADEQSPTRGIDFVYRGLRAPDTVIAPTSGVVGVQPTPQQQQASGFGNYIDVNGQPLGSTHDTTGNPMPVPKGTVGVQGVVSPQEQQFWAANPLGAVPHPVTGELIGLGNNPASRQAALESLPQVSPIASSGLGAAPPGTPGLDSRVFNPRTGQWEGQDLRGTTQGGSPQTPTPNFVNVPEVDPALQDRINQIDSALDDNANRLRGASTQRLGRGQPSQYENLMNERNSYIHARQGLALELNRQNELASTAAHQNLQMQDRYNVNRDATAAMIALGRITAQPGTPEYKQSLAQIATDYPNSMRDPRVAQAMVQGASFHNAQEQFLQQAQANGLTPTLADIGPRGPRYNFTPAMTVMNKELAEQGMPAGMKVTDIFNSAAHKGADNVPYDQLPDNGVIQVPYTDKKGQPQTANVSKGTLESLKNQFADRYQAAGGRFTQAPQATTPQSTIAPQQPQPNVTQSEYSSLKPGQTYWWNGRQLTKQ